ncbi:disulfide bond formation protein B [Natrarchaeobaculum aegyptiacum]|uniref:Disulfide bond formation protein B n=1 Tax=Natrarchaeobaculum aegyptiacum TaxID=745377 RepID=A0A2Z2HQ43_9EURY|nr:disulfide bond formation protein B [Natrarchaeobaculum aegyptiacum]ARS89236.1 disulfide bond formation protein B [Natrarchaeobaculum aegyptiacum]
MQRRLLAALTLVAAAATVGSLYFSEVANYLPCELCWYQRILMYPLVVVLGVAAIDGHSSVWKTALPLSGLGTLLAAYHSVVQVTDSSAIGCGFGGGCDAILWQSWLFTIPRLAFVAFAIISVGLLALASQDRHLN